MGSSDLLEVHPHTDPNQNAIQPLVPDLPHNTIPIDAPFEEEQHLVNVELQRIPTSVQNPLLLNLPPLMPPEILTNSGFPDIDLHKVPSLGEMNTIAIVPMKDNHDVDLKFYDAVPNTQPISKTNITDGPNKIKDLSKSKSEQLILLQKRRRKKKETNAHHALNNGSSKTRCQYKTVAQSLKAHFSKCKQELDRLCKPMTKKYQKDTRLRRFRKCLTKQYPKTKTLAKLSPELLKSGRGTLQFQTDAECTTFVHTFFAHCKNYIPSCQQVRDGERSKATLVLGCLFSNYHRMLIPLMTAKKRRI